MKVFSYLYHFSEQERKYIEDILEYSIKDHILSLNVVIVLVDMVKGVICDTGNGGNGRIKDVMMVVI